jgi:glycosidase
MREVMEMLCENYPKQVADSLMNILGTHDTMRILTALGSEYFTDDRDMQAAHRLSQEERARGVRLLKTAAVLQFTLPGFPCIYYGDEAGMEGYSDPFCRRFFPWDNIDGELSNFYKQIAGIRSENKVFADGDYELVKEQHGLFFYKRVKNGEEIYVYTNLSDAAYDLSDFDGRKNFRSLLTGEPVAKIQAGGFDIFK